MAAPVVVAPTAASIAFGLPPPAPQRPGLGTWSPPAPCPDVGDAHTVADGLEATLVAVLGDPGLSVRAVPSWGSGGWDAPTLTVELAVDTAAGLGHLLEWGIAAVDLAIAEAMPLPADDDWLAAGGWAGP